MLIESDILKYFCVNIIEVIAYVMVCTSLFAIVVLFEDEQRMFVFLFFHGLHRVQHYYPLKTAEVDRQLLMRHLHVPHDLLR